jgi:hypothetical protein
MATITKPVIKFDVKDFTQKAFGKISDSIGDMIVTVAITGITLAYMFSIIHPVYASTIPGMYLAAMIVQLFIRIVHRFDDYDQVGELGDRVIELEQSVNERLDTIIRNQYPL